MNNDMWASDDEALIEFAEPIASKIVEGFTKTKSLFSSPRIFRVPEDLRKVNECAYVPRLIAIGPLHRKDEHLQTSMKHVKMHYTDYLLYRVAKDDKGEISDEKKGDVLLNCVKEMKKCVQRAKKCYAEEVPLVEKELQKNMSVMEVLKAEEEMKEMKEKEMKETKEKEMVEMMVVDGCFILNLLYSSYHLKKKNNPPGVAGGNSSKASSSYPQPTHGGEDGSISNNDNDRMADPVLDCRIHESIVKHDLLLLENQIPFFVLENLFKLTLEEIIRFDPIMGGERPSLKDLVLDYFQDIIMSLAGDNSEGKNDKNSSRSDCVLWINEEEGPRKENGYHHILHVLHEHCIPEPCESCDLPLEPKRTGKKLTSVEIFASDLNNAGVEFVPSKGNLFDVQFTEPNWPVWWFRSARFHIPALDVHDLTETLFRNLIALEQCCPMVDPYFTAYAKFMDFLIETVKDVKVLTKAKVIRNHLGADVNVSDLFNKLSKQIVKPKDFYFNDTCEVAYKYSQRGWPKFRAYVRRTYIDCPWRSAGFLVAFTAFGITLYNFIAGLT